MTSLPQCLTLAQVVKLEKLPEDTRVVGWCAVPPGPVIRYAEGGFRVVKPDGRVVKAKGWAFA